MSDIRLAYATGGAAWTLGPSAAYDRFAEHVVQTFPGAIGNGTVLDVGAGTGALCRALRRAGAHAIAFDTSADMLAQVDGDAALCVIGDMLSLPFLERTFDAAVSGFAISHVDHPQRALEEMRRVVKPAGSVLAAVFGAAPSDPAKDAVDDVAGQFGYERPHWYVQFKARTEPLTNTPERLRECAAAAGLSDVDITDTTVDAGLETPEAFVAYRLGMAHLVPFVASLTQEQRDALTRTAVASVSERGYQRRVRILILASRVPAW